MSLGSALQSAQNSLRNVTRQTNIVSRNVTNSGNENYTQRSGVIDASSLGSRIVTVRTNIDEQLSRSSLQALGEAEAQILISSQLGQLNLALNGIDGSRSSSHLLTVLHEGLQTYSAAPSNMLLAASAIESAKDFASSLNQASSTLSSYQSSMDAQIENSVASLNRLLGDFHTANNEIVNGSALGRDVNDALDRRDSMLRDISKLIPVNVLTRENNDMVLVTKGGATLFESIPRAVTFSPVLSYGPSVTGNPLRIDGVPVLGGRGGNTTAGGKLSALLQMRDTVLPKIQTQLNEIARGAITSFAEHDATGSGLPSLTGLFIYAGSPTVPASGVHVAGLASEITINTSYDEQQGGSASLLRDGGGNGVNYNSNPTGAASYSSRVISLVQSMDVISAYDGTTGVGGSMSLLAYSAQANGWLDGQRAEASDAASTKQSLFARLSEKLSNQTGVNIDEEMSQLLQLEHSYEASARIIKTIDEMLATLMAAMR